ncbi:MAG: hypothetical protein V2B19_26980 [Pseudomonadota bacterium]
MKPEQIFQQLKDLAEKLDIKVSEQSFASASIPVKSGYCKVRGQHRFIIDKKLTFYKKNKILATFLSRYPMEEIYVVPKIREFLESHK